MQTGKNDPRIIRALAQESLTVSELYKRISLSVSNIENSIRRLNAQHLIAIQKQDPKWKGGKRRTQWQLTFRGFVTFLKDEKGNPNDTETRNLIYKALERYKKYPVCPVWVKCYEPIEERLGLPRFWELLREAAAMVFLTRSIRKRDEQLLEDFDMEFISLLEEERPPIFPIPNKELGDRFASLFQYRIEEKKHEIEKLKSRAQGVSFMFNPNIATSQIERMKQYQSKKAQSVEQTEKG